MRLLLDTHVVLACVERRLSDLPRPLAAAVESTENSIWVSVVGFWEIAIKWRLGKLPITFELSLWPEALKGLGFRFVGPTTVYAAMQAMGVVNDHLVGCAARGPCTRARKEVIVP